MFLCSLRALFMIIFSKEAILTAWKLMVFISAAFTQIMELFSRGICLVTFLAWNWIGIFSNSGIMLCWMLVALRGCYLNTGFCCSSISVVTSFVEGGGDVFCIVEIKCSVLKSFHFYGWFCCRYYSRFLRITLISKRGFPACWWLNYHLAYQAYSQKKKS